MKKALFSAGCKKKLRDIISVHVHHLKGNYLSFLGQINLRLWELPFISYRRNFRHDGRRHAYRHPKFSQHRFVRVEFLHQVGPEKIDGTHVTDVVPVCGLGCHVEIRPKFTQYDRVEFCLPLRSQWTRFLPPDMCVHVYQALFHCLVDIRPR